MIVEIEALVINGGRTIAEGIAIILAVSSIGRRDGVPDSTGFGSLDVLGVFRRGPAVLGA